jgi:hypothetical protein
MEESSRRGQRGKQEKTGQEGTQKSWGPYPSRTPVF